MKSTQTEQVASGFRIDSVRCLGRLVLSIPFVLILLVQSAHANAGTPLMWLATGHLILGNAIIGVVEGLAIALVFRTGIIRCMLIMVLANYASMIVGLKGIEQADRLLASSISLTNLRFTIIALAVASYATTLIIEWPFCYWTLNGKERRCARATGASALVNTASYALLIPLYLSVSGTSLLTDAKVQDVSTLARTKKALVFYLSPANDAVYRIRIDGSDRRKIATLGQGLTHPELAMCSVAGQPCVAVLSTRQKDGLSEEVWRVAVDSIPGLALPCKPCDSVSRWRWMEESDLRPENERGWHVRTGFYAGEGLSGSDERSGKKLWLALETPFLSWRFSSATVLPGDQVVCQLERQTVLVDLNTCRIGLISLGVSPVVIMER